MNEPSIWTNKTVLAVAPFLFFAIFLGLWEIGGRLTFSYQLSTVGDTFAAVYDRPWVLLKHGLYTLWPTLLGFAIAIAFGVGLGLWMGLSKFVYEGAYPILVFFNALPKVAIAPVLVLSFPDSFWLAVWLAFLISFFPIVVNVATSTATIERETEDVLRALGAGKLTIAWKVAIPRATPYIFGALKIAVTLAFIGSVIAEQLNANQGLGWFITVAAANGQTALGFAALLVLGLLSVMLYALFAYLEGRTSRWAFSRT